MKTYNSMVMLSVLVSSLVYGQTKISIIPRPTKVEQNKGIFELNAETKIIFDNGLEKLGHQLAGYLEPATGYLFEIENNSPKKDNTIWLKKNTELSDLGPEGYHLEVNEDQILIEAADERGIFYAMQSLRQLLPVEIFRQAKVEGIKWTIGCVKIEDKPRFKWRGMHLDSCRHFMPKEFVKKYIDLIAIHKMNTFHWHLTEDQGWRIEIKKYPKLTEIGAWRDETLVGHYNDKPRKFDGKKHGGFYTQDDVREIVNYAKSRYVTVVPEIEMPGHSLAALAAYPELSCTAGPFKTGKVWGVIEDVYCAGNDKTIKFLQDVLTEVLELFPSEFIHIGGDECPKKRWKKCPKCQARIKAEGLKDEHELQSWFIKQMDDFLTTRGRRLIGWDEILEGGLAKGATVMSWRGIKGGIAAAKAGHDVVMAPYTHVYFDHNQGDIKKEPLSIGGFTPLKKVYSYEPVPADVPADKAKHILGAQGQMWTEYICTPKHAEYMAFPRTCALAEVVWSSRDEKDYQNFYNRLQKHVKRLDAMDVNYHPLQK